MKKPEKYWTDRREQAYDAYEMDEYIQHLERHIENLSKMLLDKTKAVSEAEGLFIRLVGPGPGIGKIDLDEWLEKYKQADHNCTQSYTGCCQICGKDLR